MTSWGRAARLSLQAISRGVEPASTGCPASRSMAERLAQQQSRGMAGWGNRASSALLIHTTFGLG